MRVAVCDDNKVELDYLTRQISESLKFHAIEHNLNKFLCGKDFIDQHEKTPFDIVFLDIVMPDVSGFEVAKRIRDQSENTYIIFITTEENLVFDSFDYQPFNFIPKTETKALEIKLDNVIRKLSNHIRQNRPMCLPLSFNEKKFVKPTDIIYIVSKSNYLDIVCCKETIHIRDRIVSMLEQLSPKYFVRIHNRCIVNLKHLCKIDSTRFKALLDNGIELDISRAYKAVLIEKYNVFLRDYL